MSSPPEMAQLLSYRRLSKQTCSIPPTLEVPKLRWPMFCPRTFHFSIHPNLPSILARALVRPLCPQQSWHPTSTSEPVGLAVSASEAPVPLSAPCMLKCTHLHNALLTQSGLSAHTLLHSCHCTPTTPTQTCSMAARQPPCSSTDGIRPSLLKFLYSHPHTCTTSIRSLRPPHSALRSGRPSAAANPLYRAQLLYTHTPSHPRKFLCPNSSPHTATLSHCQLQKTAPAWTAPCRRSTACTSSSSHVLTCSSHRSPAHLY